MSLALLNDYYYYFILFDSVILLLHFLSSLIKFILRLLFSTDKKQAEDTPGKDYRVQLHFRIMFSFILMKHSHIIGNNPRI